jgi:cytochrome c-type biogenesis protein CcmE
MNPMKPRHKRLLLVGFGLAAVAGAAALVLSAFRQNLVFYYTPTQIAVGEAPHGRPFRVGGLVESGSVHRESTTVHFRVTDTARTIPVDYVGILPDLFREGKGVVAQGSLDGAGVFRASEVLAKHDENYMPPEAADAIAKAQGGKPRSTSTLAQPKAQGGAQ